MISTVKKWVAGRGYGFIAHPEGGRDLFVHFADIINQAGRPAITSLEPGTAVEFDIAEGKKGQVAKHVRLLSTLNAQPST